MQIVIEGKVDSDPKSRILAIEAVTRAICERTGQDPADGVMMLLTAAVHLTNTYSKRPISETGTVMASALGNAIVAADDFFKLRGEAVELPATPTEPSSHDDFVRKMLGKRDRVVSKRSE